MRARSTALARESQSSLRYTLCMWVLTVLNDTCNASAISRAESWVGRYVRTSSSRVLSRLSPVP